MSFRSLFFFILPLFSQSVWAESLVDFTNTNIEILKPPSRVILLAPSVAEIAGGLFTVDKHPFVGVSEFSQWPEYVAKLSSIGSYDRFNVESVVALKPDLVLATKDGNPPDRVKRLRELGLKVLVVATTNLEELEKSVKLIGRALGKSAEAEAKLVHFKRERDAYLKTAHRQGCSKKILLQVGSKPLVVVGGSSYLTQALQSLGCENVYRKSATAYPRPSIEDAIAHDPEVILVLSMDDQTTLYEAWVQDWKRFPSLSAVKKGKVKILRSDALLRPSLRWVEGLKALSEAIQ